MNKLHSFIPAILCGMGVFVSSTIVHAQLRTPSSRTPATAAAPTGSQIDYIVAIVNSEPITFREVMQQTLRAERQITQRGGALPAREQLAKQVLEKLIDDRVLVQQAIDSGIKIDDGALNEAVSNLAREGTDKARLRSEIRDEMLVNRLRERDFDSRIRIPDSEVEAYIREHAPTGQTPGEVELNLAQILVERPERADAQQLQELRQRAESIRQRLLAGEDFLRLSREFSAAQGREEGGIMGLRNASRYPESFAQAVSSAPIGGISAVIQTDAGFHILKVIEKKQAGLPAMTLTQTRSRHILLQPQPPKTEEDARRQLQQIRQRIIAGSASFEEMAKQHSGDASAAQGGDLDWANPGQFVPEFEKVMNALPTGAISDPFASRFGVHIIQVLGRREHTLPESEQRELVRQLLKEQRQQERLPQWVRDLRGNAYIEYRQAPER